ncbi:hypothetical protein CLIB1444_17S00562 [[Candida] jaroonii]|uniref:Uncharacterized protein n=1 Tax=[Candida] jaroonii TaxID=467808 RepID=A0ACA9YG63_9ASCO|nr:hypothetical protein CLIB1444_17S00562 [[Candida] jaroonii]
MFQSTISRSLIAENGVSTDIEPPDYLFSPTVSITSPSDLSSQEHISGYFDIVQSGTNSSNQSVSGGSSVLADPTTEYVQWEDTILANTDKIKDLTKYGSPIAKNIKIRIQLTEDVGQLGVQPKIIDPSTIKLQQNDYVYGFVTVKNENTFNLPFEMFCVSFEGDITLEAGQPDTPPSIKKILTMFDFNASWSDGTLDRFPEDNNNPHEPLKHDIDPVDGTCIQLNRNKVLLPGITYKKFFAFKLPEKLLDYSCQTHNSIKHLQIPSSIGKCRNEIISDGRRAKLFGEKITLERLVKPTDLGFVNSTVSYSISARILGKSKDYKFYDPDAKHENELVIANQMQQFIKVLPHDHPLFVVNRKMIEEEAMLNHINRINKIEQIIHTYTAMHQPDLEVVKSEVSELNKLKNSYFETVETPRQDTYQVFTSHKVKKNVLKTSLKGLITISTPKTTYQVFPQLHHSVKDLKPVAESEVRIPFQISYMTKDMDLSTLKFNTSVTLVASTIKSQYPIPAVFYPDMMFENNGKENDNFSYLTIRRFHDYRKQLSKILRNKQLTSEEKTLLSDVRTLSSLKVIYKYLQVRDTIVEGAGQDVVTETVTDSTTGSATHRTSHNKPTTINDIDWKIDTEKSGTDGMIFTKNFILSLNIANTYKESSQDFVLLPDFQNCYMCRLYHLVIEFNGTAIKVPLRVQHPYR